MQLRALGFAAAVALALGVAAGGASGGGTAARRPAVTIRMGDFFFKPKVVTVHIGQAVRFVNVGRIEHTVADTDAKGPIRSRLIKPRPLAHGQTQVVRFKRAGRILYLCTFHPSLMKGRIFVLP
ncbi:MAG: Copper binding protein plastocyanin/azurin family [Gaiellaceae bacterium]|nr:Copper binding protein plastocyanin/azurin family [Gaiellaceae bacterium]